MIFGRASQLIEHYEQGHCPGISYVEFMSNVTLRHIHSEIMKAPNDYAAGCTVNSAFVIAQEKPGMIRDITSEAASEYQESEAGGISILDVDDESRKISFKSLDPEVDLMDFNASQRMPLTRSNLESWPRLPNQPKPDVPDMLGKISIRSPTSSGTAMSASEFASSITRGPTSPYAISHPALAAPTTVALSNGKPSLVTASVDAERTRYGAAWTTGNPSKTLFRDVIPMSPSSDYWQGQIAQRQGANADDNTNLLHKRYWDPSNADYNVERFRHDVIGKYCCPFGGCDCSYDKPVDLSDHFKIAHMKTDYRCPLCLKIFAKGSSLMAHAEAVGGKCRVKESNVFGQLLDVISGGFLKAKQVRQPKMVKFDQEAVVKRGEIVDGVMSTKFDWNDPVASNLSEECKNW